MRAALTMTLPWKMPTVKRWACSFPGRLRLFEPAMASQGDLFEKHIGSFGNGSDALTQKTHTWDNITADTCKTSYWDVKDITPSRQEAKITTPRTATKKNPTENFDQYPAKFSVGHLRLINLLIPQGSSWKGIWKAASNAAQVMRGQIREDSIDGRLFGRYTWIQYPTRGWAG